MKQKSFMKQLYEDILEAEKEENEYLRKLVRILNDKEKHSPYDRDDFDYFEIRDIENLFDEVSKDDYYKLILVKSSFKGITNIMKVEGIKKKDYQ